MSEIRPEDWEELESLLEADIARSPNDSSASKRLLDFLRSQSAAVAPTLTQINIPNLLPVSNKAGQSAPGSAEITDRMSARALVRGHRVIRARFTASRVAMVGLVILFGLGGAFAAKFIIRAASAYKSTRPLLGSRPHLAGTNLVPGPIPPANPLKVTDPLLREPGIRANGLNVVAASGGTAAASSVETDIEITPASPAAPTIVAPRRTPAAKPNSDSQDGAVEGKRLGEVEPIQSEPVKSHLATDRENRPITRKRLAAMVARARRLTETDGLPPRKPAPEPMAPTRAVSGLPSKRPRIRPDVAVRIVSALAPPSKPTVAKPRSTPKAAAPEQRGLSVNSERPGRAASRDIDSSVESTGTPMSKDRVIVETSPYRRSEPTLIDHMESPGRYSALQKPSRGDYSDRSERRPQSDRGSESARSVGKGALVTVRICVESGSLAGEFCPRTAIINVPLSKAPTLRCRRHVLP